MNNLLKIGISTLIVSISALVNAGERVGDFSLIDHQGVFHHMGWYDDNKAIVILSHSIGYVETNETLVEFKALRAKYEQEGVVFFILNPGLQTDRAAVSIDAKSTGIDIPVLMDDTQLVSELLGFQRLGEAVIYSPSSFELLYRGPVEEQLVQTLQQVLNGDQVELLEVASSGTSITYAETQQAAPSYETDIAPIITENCAKCHRDGGIAPFAMDSHLAVQGWSPMIREVILTKRMPPGQVDNKVGVKIRNEMNLSDEEARKLIHWVNAGSLSDSTADPLAALEWPETKWLRGEPDLIIPIPPQHIPATGVLDYFDLVVDLDLQKDVWLRGSEILPGETSVLHHVLTEVIPPEGKQSQQQVFMAILNSLDPEIALPIKQKLMSAATSGENLNFNEILRSLPPEANVSALLGGSTDPNTASIAGYASGTVGQWNPPGVGGLLRAGTSLSLNMHYTTTGKELTDASQIGLYFYPEGEVPKQRMSNGIGNNFNIIIPAGAKDHEMVSTVTVPEEAYIMSLLPHMHFRGKRMRFVAQYPDGSEKLLLSVPDYSFNWQLTHYFEEPLLVPAGTKIKAIGAFDNSSQNEFNPDSTLEVAWGLQSWDEMFMGFYSWKNAEQ